MSTKVFQLSTNIDTFKYINEFIMIILYFYYEINAYYNIMIIAALTLQFVSHSFLECHDPTIGE